LSIGAVEIDHRHKVNIEDQMARADEVMYGETRKKKGRLESAPQ